MPEENLWKRAKQIDERLNIHTLVNGRSSSVMRSRRDDVWCILLFLGGRAAKVGRGRFGSVSVYRVEGGLLTRHCEAGDDLLSETVAPVLAGLMGRRGEAEPGGVASLLLCVRTGATTELRFARGAGCGMLLWVMALWVRSIAAAARLKIPPACCGRGTSVEAGLDDAATCCCWWLVDDDAQGVAEFGGTELGDEKDGVVAGVAVLISKGSAVVGAVGVMLGWISKSLSLAVDGCG